MPNVFDPEWEAEGPPHPAPYDTRSAPIAQQAGSSKLGATLYELRRGQSVCPMHIHHAQEEMIVVLSGTPTLVAPAGSRVLDTGEVVACPVGPEGAHRVANEAEELARVLIISTREYPEVVEYLDGDKVGVRSTPPGEPNRLSLNFRRGSAVGYFD
jgi:uncharacterized cupin superfamily protein